MGRPAVPLEQRFLARTAEGPPADLRPELGACLLWTGRTGADGIGRIDRGGTTITALHAAWEVALGEELPKGFVLRHHACTRTACVRAEHLRPWVAAEDIDHDRVLIGWNARHDECVKGHSFRDSRNVIRVAGGRACRACRRDTEQQRRRRAAGTPWRVAAG